MPPDISINYMSTFALNKLWEYIQALSLSSANKRWLADKLIESSQKDTSTASWTSEFKGKWQDDNMTAEEFVREIRQNRELSDRKIVEL